MKTLRNARVWSIAPTLAAALLLHATNSMAAAAWTVVNLHPAGADGSIAVGVSDGQQVGYVFVASPGGQQPRASLWSGSAASWVNLHPQSLHPTLPTHSGAVGVSGGQQVGSFGVIGSSAAALWSGSSDSCISLHPFGAEDSVAFGVSDGQQVGRVFSSGQQRASLWSGTADSWVDLSPFGTTASSALGISGVNQVGITFVGGDSHASLWSGSAASWVDLHPDGASESEASGVSGSQQIGYARVRGEYHASLWSGNAESWVDLNPAGSTNSRAYGVSGGQQVGVALDHASLWSGSAASWVDLHAFLPAGFESSVARGIWRDADHTYVAGYGFNSVTGRTEALLWTQPVPGPSALACFGFITIIRFRRRLH